MDSFQDDAATTTSNSSRTPQEEVGVGVEVEEMEDKNGYYYLSADARRQLPNYQYRGCDNSLIYHYVLSPLAQWCVDRLVPSSVAPNSITLFGLIWMFSAYAIYWYYVPTLQVANDNDNENDNGNGNGNGNGDGDDEFPRWIFLWNAVSMLAYQTLDNMDGKQARKTKSSSPLGLLFDHGCDAINSIFGSANWIIGMGLVPYNNNNTNSNDLLACYALIFGPFCMFYIATWEQYHTGELILPIVNGPNEGLLGGALLSLTSYWFGYSFWQGTEWFDSLQSLFPQWLLPLAENVTVRNCDLVILAACFAFSQEMFQKSLGVTQKYKTVAFKSLLPCAVLSLCFLVIGWIQQQQQQQQQSSSTSIHVTVWGNIPRTSLHLAMLLFVEMSTELMLAHVTAQTFDHWGRCRVLLPLIGLTMWIAVMGVNNNDTILLEYGIVAYTWSLGAYLWMKIVLVIHEICNVLGIWCFDIVTPHPKKILVSP